MVNEDFPMDYKEFTGVRELFSDFTFNRSCNMTIKTREQAKKKFNDATFKPEINKSSSDIALTLMHKYWGGSPTKTPTQKNAKLVKEQSL